jgi:Rieske Fe-S protein
VGKSTYDLDGTKVHGPAPDPITKYPASVEDDKLIATIS